MTEPMHEPTLLAIELKGFAQGVQALAEHLVTGHAADATKEQRADAEKAALAFLRNAPLAVRSIRRLEGIAEDTVMRAAQNRDDIMTSIFGPDTE